MYMLYKFQLHSLSATCTYIHVYSVHVVQVSVTQFICYTLYMFYMFQSTLGMIYSRGSVCNRRYYKPGVYSIYGVTEAIHTPVITPWNIPVPSYHICVLIASSLKPSRNNIPLLLMLPSLSPSPTYKYVHVY